MASKKRQQTFAKRKRELEVEEKRRLKREKKRAAAADRALAADGEPPAPVLGPDGEPIPVWLAVGPEYEGNGDAAVHGRVSCIALRGERAREHAANRRVVVDDQDRFALHDRRA